MDVSAVTVECYCRSFFPRPATGVGNLAIRNLDLWSSSEQPDPTAAFPEPVNPHLFSRIWILDPHRVPGIVRWVGEGMLIPTISIHDPDPVAPAAIG